ncbi:MAG TPA: arginine--tRNA ligase [Candidatus Polarisedimenticolia bacterium]|nr:arginine--tRNA ligase [Candidatus Polarisedimenticolia bacterium]
MEPVGGFGRPRAGPPGTPLFSVYSAPGGDPLEAIKEAIVRALETLLAARYGAAPDRIAVEYPPQPGLGDLASPVAFEMARRLKLAPRQIASELAAAFPPLPGVTRVDVGGAGYLNIYLDRGEAARALAHEIASPPAGAGDRGKIIVEHTNINPNKAAHIGHLRNAVLGDTLARCLRFFGHPVEVQNYIDDTGVQVADIVIGFREILQQGLEEARAIEGRFDSFCWDLYARVTEMYQARPETKEQRASVLKSLEERQGADSALADYVARRIVHCHLDTMARIGVEYDLLPWESDILAHRFWDTAFDLLKKKRAIEKVASGERQGCWVMALEGPRFADLKEGEKIIVRSNGTVTYVGKDIAYQLWKFGLLEADFGYEPFRERPGGNRVWSTAKGPGVVPHPAFGGAARVYNVIDVRQAYLQAIVVEGLKALGHGDQAARSTHFAYEMVALTPASAERLGVALADEDRRRPFIEMSGRRGLGVKADDLLDALLKQAQAEVQARNPDLEPGTGEALARAISVGALRYLMVKFTRNKVLAFDFDEALSFEGETGPYLQYAVVRAAGIFEKMGRAGGPDERQAARWALEAAFDLPAGEAAEEHWGLLTHIARFRETVAQAVETLELSQIAKYAFTLAQRFNSFYHKYPVMQEPDLRMKQARVILTYLFLAQMRQAFQLMGIPEPERM